MNRRIVSIINYLVSDSEVSLDLLSQHYHVSKKNPAQ
jgi:DeoR/GlpR family transcriptional regulator of sugar metabolism